MKISSKRQISIPKKVMEALGLQPGDELEFEIEGNAAHLIPIKTIKVPREQAWFWTPEWQAREKEADQDLYAGRYDEFDTLDDLLKDLHRED
jgi:AbrB family looped-hinge helix DNA binding protein